ncbi:MAG: T9SS-dependent M36 family metallopeptidase [Bacteroidetes bacterium]|nr:T9SS-dependent M36 family metallopeptidase [Bacteroidota bacterium]
MKKLLYLLAFLMVSVAGAQDYAPVIKSYLNNSASLGLSAQDIETISQKSSSYSKSMDVQNVYVNQQHNGIDIFNSTSSFAIRNGEVVNAASRFTANLASRVNTTNPTIDAAAAINSAASALGLPAPNAELLESNGNAFVFSNGGVSLNEIPVQLVYQPMADNSLRLSWELSIYLLDASHYYNLRIDAVNGQVLDSNDYVVSCNFGEAAHSHFSMNAQTSQESVLFAGEAAIGGDTYRVFPIPSRNPDDHGTSNGELVSDPATANASPFGWHDTDGAAGAEFTITRGNNVWSQEDINGNNGTGASPDGGATLNFDFDYNLPNAPANFTDASTTNLFYWNNVIHDMFYEYGFDEESGNFQENNYGNPGNGSDSVNADAQDGSGTNNANFATPPDGANPRMQMFLWTGGTGPVADILTMNEGATAGVYSGVPAAFGGVIPDPALTEDVVAVIDDAGGTADQQDACDAITNGADLAGKIAILRRGECEFGFKALAAQDEGAVAVIIVNNVAGDPIVMAPGAVGDQVTIPLFMVSDVDGDAIIADVLANGGQSGTISGSGVSQDLDGSLDNEIVAHEYGHGISNRLTGGPVNTSCLGNAEQMGEGWSDYIGLIMTMQTGEDGTEARGLAAYASQSPGGIRPAPYSTDTGINDFTYGDSNSQVVPHGVGFVWATAIWDLTWAFVDEYGFDSDLYTGTGGNNIALQLVMDGMKLQPCSPGFVDGRDAIIEADQLANGGANCELIWTAFAARGLGANADQGSTFSSTDQTEDFTVPSCDFGTEDQNFDRNFKIFPNPSNGQVNISSIVNLGETKVSIFDMNGRRVYSTTVKLGNQSTINASGLTSGVYVIKIDGGNYAHTSKLIIQ